MLLSLLEPLGSKGAEITARIIEFVDNAKVGVLGSLGFAMLFYTVGIDDVLHAFTAATTVALSGQTIKELALSERALSNRAMASHATEGT